MPKVTQLEYGRTRIQTQQSRARVYVLAHYPMLPNEVLTKHRNSARGWGWRCECVNAGLHALVGSHVHTCTCVFAVSVIAWARALLACG